MQSLENLESRRLLHANPAISVSDVALMEGQVGETAFVFTVSLSKPSSKRISVDFATANGSALAGADYVHTSGTLNFARGQTSKTFAVRANGDTTVEQDETFIVTLRHPSNASIADARGIGSIINDDIIAPPLPPVEPPIEPYQPPSDYPTYTDPTYEYYDPGWFNPPLEGGAYW